MAKDVARSERERRSSCGWLADSAWDGTRNGGGERVTNPHVTLGAVLPFRPSSPSPVPLPLPLSDLPVPVAGLAGSPLDCLTSIWPAEPSFTALAGSCPLPGSWHRPTNRPTSIRRALTPERESVNSAARGVGEPLRTYIYL